MPLSQDSLDKLKRAKPELKVLAEDVCRIMPIRVLDSKRSGQKQHELFVAGFSKCDYPPGGKHNTEPLSEAIDLTPDPYDLEDKNFEERLCFMGGMFMMAALYRGIKIRWGRDWDSDTDLSDQKFNDYFHIELV